MTKIQYTNDTNGSEQITKGSDGRLNVSSRADSRVYYNSRDEQESFVLSWDDATSASTDFILYWKNTDTTGRQLVISTVTVSSIARADFELFVVTGTAAGGTATTPICLNRASPRSAQATAITAVSAEITGLSEEAKVGSASVTAGATTFFNLNDTLRLGQDQAIGVKCLVNDSTPARTFGQVTGFYE